MASNLKLKTIAERNFVNLTKEYVQFAGEKHNCRACSLYSHYEQIIQSEGNISNPTFMVCGEAPGSDELVDAKPFVGRAGKRLREELKKHKDVFNKKTTVITNLVPCRPFKNKFPEKDTEDGNEEVLGCIEKWLNREIKLLKPKIIITLGAQPLYYLRNQKGITEQHGKWKYLERYSAWSMATFHPSYVLRCQNDKSKKYIVEAFSQDIEMVAKLYKRYLLNTPKVFMSNTSDDFFSKFIEEMEELNNFEMRQTDD